MILPCPMTCDDQLTTASTTPTRSVQSFASWLHRGQTKEIAQAQVKESALGMGIRSKSKRRKLQQRERLEEFLKTNGFADVFEPRLAPGCLFRAETIYPLHLAAQVAGSVFCKRSEQSLRPL